MKDVFELDDDYFTKPQKLGLKEVTAATRATFMALAGSLPRDEQADVDVAMRFRAGPTLRPSGFESPA